jgi:RHS repeat-associated protein
VKPGYGPGLLKGKTRVYATKGCSYYDPTVNAYRYHNYQGKPWQTQAYLTFTDPDGTEHEFVDKKMMGGLYTFTSTMCDAPVPTPREKVWVSKEDSAVTFIADEALPEMMGTVGDFSVETFYGPSGVMIKKDGTRYRIDGGLVSWVRDRNGNLTAFHYDGNRRVDTITDSLGRRVTFDYDVDDQTLSPDGAPFGLCDRINYEGINGVSRTVRVTKTTLANALADGFAMQTTAQLWPHMGAYGNATQPLPVPVVSALWLPDNRSYKFTYNSFAELARVELPTGGAVEYTHDYTLNFISPNWVSHTMDGYPLFRRVSEKREYTVKDDPASLTVRTTFGNIYADSYNGGIPAAQPVVVDQRDKNNKLLSRTKHYFIGHPVNLVGDLIRQPPWDNGLEKQTEFIDADDPTGQAVLKRVNYTWAPRVPAQGTSDALDIRLLETETTFVDSNLVTKQKTAYDDLNNVTDTWDYEYGVGSPTPYPARRVHTDYLTTNNNVDYTSPDGPHIRNLPRAQQVYSVNPQTGAETLAAQSETKYDETALIPWYGAVEGWVDPGARRGNPTRSVSWLNTTGVWLESRTQYDQVGNATKSWDPLNRMSEVEYSGLYKYAFPTKVTQPAPDPSGLTGSSSSLVTEHTFDIYTGLPLTATNINAQVTRFEYGGPLSRPTRVIPPPGGPEVEYDYGDDPGNLYVKVKKQINQTDWEEDFTYFDGLGRPVKAKSTDAQGEIFSETAYDSLGRVSKTSNPYRPGEAKSWVETHYDGLGRVKEIISPKVSDEAAPAKLSSDYGAATIGGEIGLVFSGINQAGKKARTIINALGQVVRVDEPDDEGNLGPIDNPVQPTYYKYDGLGHLVRVKQGAQYRYFLYDSLGRLLRVRQPEQDTNPELAMPDPITGNSEWSTGFTYYDDGSLKSSTDVKGNTINYDYDRLNRIVRKSYVVTPSADPKKYTVSTPTVTYKYDGLLSPSPGDPSPSVVQLATGSLTEISNGVSATQHTAFDNSGRVSASRQIVDGVEYDFGYEYNLSGALTKETYPSGRLVTSIFDSKGDLSSVSGVVPGQAVKAYADSFRYTAGGSADQIRLGNGRWETYQFNAREQMKQAALGVSPTDASLWKIKYEYGRLAPDGSVDVSKNDGNVLRQTITVPGVANPYEQTYKYDSLNRLSEAQETSDGQRTWKQTYGYDRYGNRTSFSYSIGQTPVPLSNVNNPAIDPLTNRFLAGQNYDYDRNGNLMSDAEGRRFAFDGDNKQREIKDAYGNVVAAYSYDGSGRRVKKTVAATQEVTVFVYDAAGKLAAEYSNAPVRNPATCYITSDILNTPRVITNSGGEVVSRKDYMPFGEETYAGRPPEQKYGAPSGVRQGFTGFEKDEESQLNFAEARYYNFYHGRFTTVDPFLASGDSSNPQSFNRYAYAGNNPTLRTDPDGEKWFYVETPKLYGYTTRWVRTYHWNPTTPGEYRSVSSHVFYANDGSSRGWHVLDPWEKRVQPIARYEDARGQLQKFQRQAALNYIAGVAESMSLVVELTGALDGYNIERDSEQYKFGRNSGAIISGLSAASGVGIANFLSKKFGSAAGRFVGKGLKVLNESCFVAGTAVHTADGPKPIEKVSAGDTVLSWNERTKTYEYKTVTRTFVRRTEQLVKVHVSGEVAPIVTTPEHPFYVRVHQARDALSDRGDEDDEGEWVAAVELRAGDRLLLAGGGGGRVVEVVTESRREVVYNFEVEDNHDYFVGTQGTLVHNNCFTNQLPGRLAAELAEAARLGVKPIKAGAAGFDAAVNSGTVKWVVTANGELLVVPKFVNGVEIAHTVMTRGGPVLAAGEADIATSGGRYVLINLVEHSGHYQPTAESLDIGRAAFALLGIK